MDKWEVQKYYNDAKEQPYCVHIAGDPSAKVCDIRGWGYLTGKGGGLGLPDDEAIAIQNKWASLIAEAPAMYEALGSLVLFIDGIQGAIGITTPAMAEARAILGRIDK